MNVWISLIAIAAAAAGPSGEAASLAGLYDGGQTEMAAGLALEPDGRFRFALSYGALDEVAEGKWTAEGGEVLLTSDAYALPRFALVGQTPAPEGELRIGLDPSSGFPPHLFKAAVDYADGRREVHAFDASELSIAFDPALPPTAIMLAMPLFAVESGVVAIDPEAGYALSFAFEPNDLGRVAFDRTPLEIDEGELLLPRHDRLIRFRRVQE